MKLRKIEKEKLDDFRFGELNIVDCIFLERKEIKKCFLILKIN
jgi:hypothetical protein